MTSTHSTAAPNNAESSEASKLPARHVSSLDALRAFAIAPVLAVHAGVPGFRSGGLGVDLFFSLSGFLITTLLLTEYSKTGALSLTNFWARRFLRLMPAYYLYALGITVAIWLWPGSKVAHNGYWGPLGLTIALWSYLMNYVPMGGIWNGQGVTVHLWSLAVEEQYYIFWPIVLCVLLKATRSLLPISWALVGTVTIYFVCFASDETRNVMLYGRGISLFLASAAAVTLHRWQVLGIQPRFLRRSANNSLTAALLASLIAYALGNTELLTQDQLRRYLLPILLVFYVLAIARLWYGSTDGIWKIILFQPALIYIGRISYGLYLYHEVVRVFTWWATAPLLQGLPRVAAYGIRLAIYLSLSVAVAGISFRFYERPFLTLRNRFR
jgi:peptidoglycan/LPS O-acetylase OafA/YrhL